MPHQIGVSNPQAFVVLRQVECDHQALTQTPELVQTDHQAEISQASLASGGIRQAYPRPCDERSVLKIAQSKETK